ncbi:MAG: hypothetical protein AAB403_20665, partial [Planctomycetota bacterium]
VERTGKLGLDLWTLDMLWWRLLLPPIPAEPTTDPQRPPPPEPDEAGTPGEIEASQLTFGLERHLHEFLVDNWEATELGRSWSLYEKDGEVLGSQYETGEVGRIDILARC